MVDPSYSDDSNDIGATFSVVGLAAAAAGIWSLFNQAQNSNSNHNHNQREIEQEFAQACQFMQQGQYQQAISIFFSILQKNPSHAPTYGYLAWIYAIHNYELDQALEFANRAIELAQTDWDRICFMDTLAEVHAHRGEIDRAINLSFQFLQSMQQLNQVIQSPVTYFRLAWCYQSQQDFNAVYGFLQQALAINGLGAGDYAIAGDICQAMGFSCIQNELYHHAITHLNNGKNQYETSMAIANNQGVDDNWFRFKLSETFNNLGVAFYFLEDFKNGYAAYQSAYNYYPYNPYPPINLAMLAALQNDKQLMRYWLEIGIPLIADNPPFWQAAHLISIIIHDQDFEAYRSEVLGMLLAQNKISPSEYRRSLENWHSRQKQPIVNQQNFYNSVGNVVGSVAGNLNNQPQTNNNSFNRNIRTEGNYNENIEGNYYNA